jgi:hypothetical protein
VATSIQSSQRAKDLIAQGDKLFSKRSTLMSLWQEVADNFYVERADFTAVRTLGEDYAAGLNTSYPLIVRRELGDAISAMLRPKSQPWMSMTVENEDRLSTTARQFLEWATSVQRRAMYDRQAQFERATKQGDHDYATFGQCVISIEVNWDEVTLLYRNWHLRDVAWCEKPDGSIGARHHNLKMTAKEMARRFGERNLHHSVKTQLRKDAYCEFNCRRIVMPAEDYDAKGPDLKWVSVYVDLDNQVLLQEQKVRSGIYVIPRWMTVSGSQYAFSPAVVAGLPDARLLQSMALTLIEASEMAVRPPMLSVGEVIQGGIQLFPGGITQVDAQHDDRLGSPLRPVIENPGSLPFGMEFEASKQEMLSRAFYLNKLRALPPKEMTAYEAGVWTSEWIRQAIPLFEPLETEYNAAICEQTFDELLAVNAFGPPQEIPREVMGQKIDFKFESPLSKAIERQKGQKFAEARALIEQAVALDPASGATVDARIALRDALHGVGVPAKWMRSEEAVERHARELADQQAQKQQAALQQQGAATAVDATKAAQQLAEVA